MSSSHRRPASAGKVRTRWAGFTARFGWRAYAVPVLVGVTAVALSQGGPASATHPSLADRLRAVGAGAVAAGHRTDPATPPVILRRDVDGDVCAGNGYDRLAVVSISRQHAWMCEKHRQVFSTAVTTGATVDHDQTPLGSWRVQGRERDRDLVGPGYDEHVNYWVPFNGDFGFHDATWQTMPFGSPGYTTQGSHGCVHMPTASMQWFYGWARVGSTVVTVED